MTTTVASTRREGAPVSQAAARRRAFHAARRRRATAVATVGTAVLAALAWWQIVGSPGWTRARAAFGDPGLARESLPAIAEGLWLNLRVWIVAALLAVLLGLAIAVLRTSRGVVLAPARFLATAYVDVMRGLPLLLVLYLVGFGLPALRLPWLPVSGVFLGTLAIVMTYTAYAAEALRAGIEAVHPSQVAAARSLGLTRGQAMRHVVLPQALRNVAAPLASILVSLQKDSGLISILGAVDAIRAAQIAASSSYNFTPYVVAGVLFLLVSIPLTRVVDAVAAGGWRRSVAGTAIR